ncbi:ABC transporter ATP-binding protein [Arthrobacter sp.]|uniref:ABC transporter ATP-binding protein n=1 Tax=Arthrobacter sp. TaxID=1667 RepID=UPI003A91B679
MTAALRATGIEKTYGQGTTAVHACAGIDLQVDAGELLVIRGRSGSGKTTLLNCLGGLDRPDAGQVWIGEHELTAMREADRVELRQRHLGFVFQGFGLLPMLTAAENVEVPLRIVGTPADLRDARVAELLDLVGLSGHRDQRPGELSGGQQQRVGIARALANEPQLLIADEPTGQLDAHTAASVMDLLRSLTTQRGVAVLVTTHDPLLAGRADRVLQLHDGALAGTP